MNTTPQPCDGEVHVYCRTLPHHPFELSRLEQLLSASETDRAALLKNDQARKRYIAGRGALREILGEYLGIDPEKVRIDTAEHGKPFLSNGENNLSFNLSHSGDMFVLAVATGIEVGIDIEQIEADKPVIEMARLAFSPREQEELFSLPSPAMQTAAFFRCWVRKEACLKACGSGFSLPSNSFDVPVCSKEPPLLTISCGQKVWHILDIEVPENYSVALAVEARSSSSPPKVVRVAPENLRT